MQNKVYRTAAVALSIAAALAVAAPALAATTSGNGPENGPGRGGMMRGGEASGMMNKVPGVFGTVASVSGTTLTVTSKMQKPESDTSGTVTSTTYTVDASGATVTKDNAASTVSAIAVGDTVMVEGTVSGTNVTAKTIRDGVMQKGMKPGEQDKGQNGQGDQGMNSIIKGNGQPVVGGSVTAISGSMLTVTNKSGATYSVDVTNAAFEKGNATSTLAAITVGDYVLVQGAVNGSSITASSVIDQGATAAGNTATKPKGVMGFFSGIGGFFAHLFGF